MIQAQQTNFPFPTSRKTNILTTSSRFRYKRKLGSKRVVVPSNPQNFSCCCFFSLYFILSVDCLNFFFVRGWDTPTEHNIWRWKVTLRCVAYFKRRENDLMSVIFIRVYLCIKLLWLYRILRAIPSSSISGDRKIV